MFITREEAQRRVDMVDKYGSQAAAARALGMNRSALQENLRNFEKKWGIAPSYQPKLVRKGKSELCGPDGKVRLYWDKSKQAGLDPQDAVQLPAPKHIKQIATLYDQQGNVTQQWVTERPKEAERERLWREMASELAATMPRAEPLKTPPTQNSDLCAVYPFGDMHIGMLAWHEETGEDYDLKIAEELVTSAIDHLVKASGPCGSALIVFIGDTGHYDSTIAVTPAHKNQLDADSRYPKMIRALIRSIRYTITTTLLNHERVEVIVEIGNHDPYTAVFLAECLYNLYENEPRVIINRSPSHYHYFEFGANLIGTHHGHGAKMEKLPLIMATDKPEAWGRTKHRAWLTGHIHHKQFSDFNGCTVESLRILAAPDAYAHQKGYRPIRNMVSIVLHREDGEVARHTVSPRMFLRSA
jgi:hypothetical protein